MSSSHQAISSANYVSLATFRKDGRRVATPIWAAALNGDDSRLVMFSGPNAGKVKRLRNSPAAEVAICDVHGKLLGDWISAEAFLIESADEQATAERAIRAKYGWQSMLLDFTSWVGGRLHKRQYVRIELSTP